MKDSSKHQLDLIKDLHDVSCIINGKMEIEFSVFDLRKIIKGTLADYLPAADKNIILVGSFDASKCEILGEAKRLRQK